MEKFIPIEKVSLKWNKIERGTEKRFDKNLTEGLLLSSSQDYLENLH